MKKTIPILMALAVLVLSSLACSFTVNLPKTDVGATQTWPVTQPVLQGYEENQVTIQMGAGTLDLSAGADGLVAGEVRYNVPEWKPELDVNGDQVTIHQSDVNAIKLSTKDVVNDWEFQLGSSPIDLTIQAGAYQGQLDLGGLSLTNLDVSDGASQAEIHFDEPNQVPMRELHYKTGASEVSLYGLSNTNANQITFDGGAGSYKLDFSGNLQNDMNVSVKVGVCNLEIVIPEGMSAQVSLEGGLNNIHPTGQWTISNNLYETGEGGPTIYITLDMGLGNLDLISQ